MAKSNIKDVKGYPKRTDFRSDSEVHFAWFIDELLTDGYIKSWTYEEETFDLVGSHKVPWKKQMRTKIKDMEFTLTQGCTYQPDFKINWDESAKDIFYYERTEEITQAEKDLPYFYAKDGISRIEIKPSHDFQNKTQQAIIKIKWLLQVKDVYVQVVIPTPSVTKGGAVSPTNALFHSLFVPYRYSLTDGATKDRKIRFNNKTLDEWVDKRQLSGLLYDAS